MDGVLAIIPARGGSKGIPRKNLVDLGGKPLITHSIAHALGAQQVSRVVVSTEDEQIAEVARRAGAEVPFMRPAQLAEDQVLDLPVFAHVLDRLEREEGYQPELVVHLRPTAPHRKPGWIDEAVTLLRSRQDAHSVRSVSEVEQHPFRVFELDGDGLLAPIMAERHPRPYELRRQDLPAMYYYNCVIDVTRPTTLRDLDSMTGTRILPFMMAPADVIDIDTPRDLEIARAIFWKNR